MSNKYIYIYKFINKEKTAPKTSERKSPQPIRNFLLLSQQTPLKRVYKQHFYFEVIEKILQYIY